MWDFMTAKKKGKKERATAKAKARSKCFVAHEVGKIDRNKLTRDYILLL